MPTVLQATQLGTLGITAPHNRTYPEYSWVVSCVVLCYAVGVLYAMCLLLCMLLCTTTLYSITLAMLYVYTEVWRILLIGPWLWRCSVLVAIDVGMLLSLFS